jgi:hypothetical protein
LEAQETLDPSNVKIFRPIYVKIQIIRLILCTHIYINRRKVNSSWEEDALIYVIPMSLSEKKSHYKKL